MNQVINKTTVLVAIASTLMSFTNFGVEGFQIFLNNKMVVQQFGKMADTSHILLDQSLADDQLKIKYYHCGQIGTNRTIVIKDGKNNQLKEWHFADAASSSTPMLCNVKDI